MREYIGTFQDKARIFVDDHGVGIRLQDTEVFVNIHMNSLKIERFSTITFSPLSGKPVEYFCEHCQKIVRVELIYDNAHVKAMPIICDGEVEFVNKEIHDACTRWQCLRCGAEIDDFIDLDDDDVVKLISERIENNE